VFVHSIVFVATIPLGSWHVSDTIIEDGTPLGISNCHHPPLEVARDVPALGRPWLKPWLSAER
jgi:hypothetical protein